MLSFKLSVDDENVPWLNLTEKLPKTETTAGRSRRSQSHNRNYVRENRHTNTHSTGWYMLADVITAALVRRRGQPEVSPLNSELGDPTPSSARRPIDGRFDFTQERKYSEQNSRFVLIFGS